MEDLVERLMQQGGLTEMQAIKAIEIIKNYTKEKFPMFGGAIDNLFKKYRGDDKNDFID